LRVPWVFQKNTRLGNRLGAGVIEAFFLQAEIYARFIADGPAGLDNRRSEL
jgi:hypothetical protein